MTNPDNGWCFWGIGPKKFFRSQHSYDDTEVIGICSDSAWRPWQCQHNESLFNPSRFGNCEIDIFLDLDSTEMRMCIVGKTANDSKYAKEAIWYEVKNKSGWVPHFNFDSFLKNKQKIQIAKVPLEWYGKEAKIEWDVDNDHEK